MPRPPPTSTLFPYTTLFRSQSSADALLVESNRPKRIFNLLNREQRKERQYRTSGDHLRRARSEEHTSELQSHSDLVCRLLLEKKKKKKKKNKKIKKKNETRT